MISPKSQNDLIIIYALVNLTHRLSRHHACMHAALIRHYNMTNKYRWNHDDFTYVDLPIDNTWWESYQVLGAESTEHMHGQLHVSKIRWLFCYNWIIA